MSGNSVQSRVPPGLPTGGQWAANVRGEGSPTDLASAPESTRDLVLRLTGMDVDPDGPRPEFGSPEVRWWSIQRNLGHLRDDEAAIVVAARFGGRPGDTMMTMADGQRIARNGFDADTFLDAAHKGLSHELLAQPGITPDKVDILADHGPYRTMLRRGGWTGEGVQSATAERLSEIAQIDDAAQKYVAIATEASPVRGARAQECIDAGIRDMALIEGVAAGRCDPKTLAGIRDAYPKTSAFDVVHLATNGHDAASVKKWGMQLSKRWPRLRLAETNLAPTTIRALRKASRDDDLDEIVSFADHGFTLAEHVTGWRTAILDHTADAKTLAAIRDTGVDRDVLENYRKLVPISLVTPRAASRIAAISQEHPDPKTFRDKVKGIKPHRTNEWTRDRLAVLEQMATMDQTDIDRLLPTGIPLYRLGEFVNDPDPWEAGRPYREQWSRDNDGADWPG